jgi:hypothetical protein
MRIRTLKRIKGLRRTTPLLVLFLCFHSIPHAVAHTPALHLRVVSSPPPPFSRPRVCLVDWLSFAFVNTITPPPFHPFTPTKRVVLRSAGDTQRETKHGVGTKERRQGKEAVLLSFFFGCSVVFVVICLFVCLFLIVYLLRVAATKRSRHSSSPPPPSSFPPFLVILSLRVLLFRPSLCVCVCVCAVTAAAVTTCE